MNVLSPAHLDRQKREAAAIPIGVVINGHREGELLGQSLESLRCACDAARNVGLQVDIVLVLDRPDSKTCEVGERYRDLVRNIVVVDVGNLGAARQAGLDAITNDWIAFLDGDDLISKNWLCDAFLHAQTSARPYDTVFHTEMFVGFGAEVFFRRALRTTDPEFDPLCLLADWFFCNNLFAHRSVFERFPIEPYDHKKGLGAEDWHWSCQTTSDGIDRDFVPNTVYFYRVKPVEQSLGLTPGLIHKASRLFSKDSVAAISSQRADLSLAEPARTRPAPESPRLRTPVPQSVAKHALEQAVFDAALTDVARTIATDPLKSVTFPPRMSYGAAEFYRRTAPRLNDKAAVAIFWGSNRRLGGAMLLTKAIQSVQEKYPDHQVVVFSELPTLVAEAIDENFPDDQLVVLDYDAARSKFGVPPNYLALLTTRYFLQFDFAAIVACGSMAFEEAISTYGAAISWSCKRLFELSPIFSYDRADVEFDQFLGGLQSRTKFEYSLICLSDKVAQLSANFMMGRLYPAVGYDLRRAIGRALKARWRGEPSVVASALSEVDFSVVFSQHSYPESRRHMASASAGRRFTLASLGNGSSSHIPSLLDQSRDLPSERLIVSSEKHAEKYNSYLEKVSKDTLAARVVANWTVGEVLAALDLSSAESLVVIESGFVASRVFLRAVEEHLNGSSLEAFVPEAVLTRDGNYWSFGQIAASGGVFDSKSDFIAPVLPVIGCIALTRNTLNELRSEHGAAMRLSADLCVIVLAALAARRGQLRAVRESLAVGFQPLQRSRSDWPLLLNATRSGVIST